MGLMTYAVREASYASRAQLRSPGPQVNQDLHLAQSVWFVASSFSVTIIMVSIRMKMTKTGSHREDNRKFAGGLQAMVTNGHCGKEPSVVIAKLNDMVLLGAEANMSRSFPLPIVNKPWKEVIYIKDENKLEGRVCGATYNDWCIGKIKDTGCGFQIGAAQNMAGYVGLLDDIHIYRCKPLETVININY